MRDPLSSIVVTVHPQHVLQWTLLPYDLFHRNNACDTFTFGIFPLLHILWPVAYHICDLFRISFCIPHYTSQQLWAHSEHMKNFRVHVEILYILPREDEGYES